MTVEERNMERFEAYLTGKLSSEERMIFESEMSENKDLREELAIQKKAHLAIAYLNRKALKQKLVLMDAETTAISKQRQIRKFIVRLAVAASIVLLAGFGFIFITDYFGGESSLAELSEEYFIPTTPESFRGDKVKDTPGYEEQLVVADNFFQKGDYASAIREYKRLSQIDNTRSELAQWNLVMSYLMSESHPDECEKLLNQIIADKTHTYHERAIRLRREL